MIHLLFLIRSLTTGGAQRQLIELVRILDRRTFQITIATFYTGGFYWNDLAAIPGVRLVSLRKQGRWDIINFFRRFRRLVREVKPDVIYSFAQEPNLVALNLGWAAGVRVLWGIRRSTKELPHKDRLEMACYWLGKLLSRFPARVVFNSIHGRALYLERGYCRRNAVVVSNGFNTEYFQPNAQARQMQRAIWGIGESESVVGLVGRLNPVKDHPLFLKVAAQILRICRSVRFVCVGGGPQAYEAQLRQEAERLGLRDRILWVGESSNMSAVYNALDILTLCSKEEGCPNVVGEAMACGVPCVVTDVGDAAYLLGDRKYVTPPGHPLAMAHAVKSVLDLSQEKRLALGGVARQRIIDNFSLHVLATRTEALLKDVTSEF